MIQNKVAYICFEVIILLSFSSVYFFIASSIVTSAKIRKFVPAGARPPVIELPMFAAMPIGTDQGLSTSWYTKPGLIIIGLTESH